MGGTRIRDSFTFTLSSDHFLPLRWKTPSVGASATHSTWHFIKLSWFRFRVDSLLWLINVSRGCQEGVVVTPLVEDFHPSEKNKWLLIEHMPPFLLKIYTSSTSSWLPSHVFVSAMFRLGYAEFLQISINPIVTERSQSCHVERDVRNKTHSMENL